MSPRSVGQCVGAEGYTLTELLIVVTILVILIAIALPVAKHAIEDSKVRESSRQLSSYFAMAKTRAAQTGRPCGVAFQVDPIIGSTSAYQVTQMYLAEVAAPYGGSTIGARARIDTSSGTPPYFLTFPVAGSDLAERAVVASLLDKDEYFLVRFDYKGDWFSCQRQGVTDQFRYVGSVSGNATPPSAAGTAGYPFQILRAPRRTGQPRELPGGTCIDLTYSGSGTTGTEFAPPGYTVPSLVIMFNAGGSLAGYYKGSSTPTTAPGTLHFLVGRPEKMAAATLAQSNLADPTSIWVSIGRLTGSVTSAENIPNAAVTLASAREAATNREQMGGR